MARKKQWARDMRQMLKPIQYGLLTALGMVAVGAYFTMSDVFGAPGVAWYRTERWGTYGGMFLTAAWVIPLLILSGLTLLSRR